MEEKKLTVESLACEVINQAKHQAKLWFAAWLITLGVLFVTNAAWIYVFQSYDYVSQDGSGINSINSGQQGDISIGAETQTEEEWKQQGN